MSRLFASTWSALVIVILLGILGQAPALAEGLDADEQQLTRHSRSAALGENTERGQALSNNGTGFRISLDGAEPGLYKAPTAENGKVNLADTSRLADIAAADAQVQLSFDALTSKPVLSVVASPLYVISGQRVEFTSRSNYANFVRRSEIRLFADGANRKDKPIQVVPVELNQQHAWLDWTLPSGDYQFVLRVYDAANRFDETLLMPLSVGTRTAGMQHQPDDIQAQLIEDHTATRNILILGGTVQAFVSNVPANHQVTMLGEPLAVDPQGRALGQTILPFGSHDVEVQVLDANGQGASFIRPLHIASEDAFLVGIADLTLGQRDIDGNIEATSGPETDLDDNFVNGRIAFYYKGRIKGKYLTTIAADSEEDRIEDLFDNFGRKDARSFLRRIDPDQFYPVYGDDSTTLEDAPSAGNLYIRIERDKSRFLWGDFQTTLAGMDLVQYSRALYGANFTHQSTGVTELGEARTDLSLFAADPGTIASRDEFRGTGGTLYYLRRQDVSEGSERVFVEVRDRDSQLVLSRQELIGATDYDMNYIQGRVSLRSPLASTADGVRFVRDGSLAGNPAFLVITYEFTPTISEPDTFSSGGRLQHWLNDSFALGIAGFDQGDEGFEQTLLGADLTWRHSANTYVRTEYAHANGPGNGAATSSSGGFAFNDLNATDESADAQRVELSLDLADVSDATGQLAAYWQDREAGFSSPGQLTGSEAVSQFGIQGDMALAERTNLIVKGDSIDSRDRKFQALEAGVKHKFTNGWHTGLGARFDDREQQTTTASDILNQTGSRTDTNLQVGYDTQYDLDYAGERDWGAYLFGQSTLANNGTRRNNDRLGAGGRYRFNERFAANAELSDGHLGSGATLGGEYNYSARGSLYLSHTLQAENPDAFNTGRLGRSTLGVRNRFNDAVSIFAEARRESGNGPTGTTQHFGIDFTPWEKWLYSVTYETGTLTDPLTGDIERDAATATLGFSDTNKRLSATVEIRNDDNPTTGKLEILAFRGLASLQMTPATRVYAKVHASETQSDIDPTFDAEFGEYVLAGAYRPVEHDWLNLLVKYTYLEDLPSPAQVSALGVPIDFAQRSHVFAIDGTVQLTRRLSVGAKYAYRTSELRPSRDSSAPWFDSNSDFIAARADWYFVESWDLLIEGRRLTVREANDRRTGMLAAVYRHVGNHLKIGVGYNFTDFSDDLTDLSFDSRGAFVNLVGVF